MTTQTRFARLWIIISLILIGVITVWFVGYKASERRSWLGREVRLGNGEYFPEQYVHDLTEDLHGTAFAGLQPWALDILARYRTGQLQTNNYRGFIWVDSSVTLGLAETPHFLSPDWASTNSGLVLPEISVVLNDHQPECVVLDWGTYGIAAGEPNYRLSFSPAPDIVTNISPGVYIFGYRK